MNIELQTQAPIRNRQKRLPLNINMFLWLCFSGVWLCIQRDPILLASERLVTVNEPTICFCCWQVNLLLTANAQLSESQLASEKSDSSIWMQMSEHQLKAFTLYSAYKVTLSTDFIGQCIAFAKIFALNQVTRVFSLILTWPWLTLADSIFRFI